MAVPVLIMALAIIKELQVNQDVVLLNPLNPSSMVNVPDSTTITIVIIAIAPWSRGFVTKATTIARKILSKCHASASTPSGGGKSQTIIPKEIGNAKAIKRWIVLSAEDKRLKQ